MRRLSVVHACRCVGRGPAAHAARTLLPCARTRCTRPAGLQAGLFIWQLLYPNSKPAKEKREESIKLGLVEVRGLPGTLSHWAPVVRPSCAQREG